MTIKDENIAINSGRGQTLMAVGGLLGALAASSCCILPVVLFSLGVSGAWIGNFTRLAPYQPYFLAATLLSLGTGYWLVHRASKLACVDGEACARPLPNQLVKAVLIVATILVMVARFRLPCAAFSQLMNGRFPMNKLMTSAAFALCLFASSAAFAGEKTVTLAVQNMYCAACPHTVKASLKAVPGVAKVAVSYQDKTAIVTYDDSKTDVKTLINATTGAGYPSAPKG